MKFGTFELSIAGIGLGLFGLGWAIHANKQSADMARKLGMSINDISMSTPVQIKEAVVNKAIEQAANREAYRVARDVSSDLGKKIRSDMDSMIRKDVDSVYDSMKDKVEEHVTELVSDIDIDDIKNGVKNKVTERLAKQALDWAGLGNIFKGSRTSSYSGQELQALKSIIDTVPWSERADVIKAFANKD